MKNEQDQFDPIPERSPDYTPISADSTDATPPEVIQEQADLLISEHGPKEKAPYFVDYLDPTISLEDRLDGAFGQLQVSKEQQEKILKYLGLLDLKHKETYRHSIRVGLAAKGIAEHQHLDAKALLYAGLMHDVGKSMIPLSTLGKTEGWTSKDTETMDGHVMKGYELLRDTFDFSAEVILLHHRFQSRQYPEQLPEPLHEYADETQNLIQTYGRILALADVYDALHRVNEKFGGLQAFSGQQVKEQMLRMNPDEVALVEELFAAGVFTTAVYPKKEEGT